MPAAQDRSLKVFISYASEDLKTVREIVRFLQSQKIEVWFDKESLQLGQDWNFEIRQGIKKADAVIACLSSRSVKKEGFIQKELRLLVDKADEKPEGMIFILPVKLDDCQPPSYLEQYQWLDFSDRKWQEKLWKSLQIRAKSLGVSLSSSGRPSQPRTFDESNRVQVTNQTMKPPEEPEYSAPPVRRYWPIAPKAPPTLVRPPTLPKGLSHNPFPFERAEKESAFLFHPRYGFFWNEHPLWQKLRLVCESTTLVHGAKGSGRTALALALGKYLSHKSVLTSYSNRPQRLKDIQSLFSKTMLDFIATNPFYLPRDASRAGLLKQWIGTHMPDSLIQARLSQAREDLETEDWVHDAGDEKTRANYLAEAWKILNKFGKLDGGETQVYDTGQSFEILIQCAQALGFSRVRTVFDLGDHLRNDDLQDLDDLIHEAPNQIEIIIFAPTNAAWVSQLESSFVTQTLTWKHGGINLLEKMVTHRWKIVSQNDPPQAFFSDGAFEYLIEISQTNPGRFMALWGKLMDLKGGAQKISVELINTARKLVDE